MSKIEQSGRSSLRRPKLPTKGGSATKEGEEEVHLVGFIIRIYHDSQSPEPQRTSNKQCVTSNNFYLNSVGNNYKNKTPNFDKRKLLHPSSS